MGTVQHASNSAPASSMDKTKFGRNISDYEQLYWISRGKLIQVRLPGCFLRGRRMSSTTCIFPGPQWVKLVKSGCPASWHRKLDEYTEVLLRSFLELSHSWKALPVPQGHGWRDSPFSSLLQTSGPVVSLPRNTEQ